MTRSAALVGTILLLGLAPAQVGTAFSSPCTTSKECRDEMLLESGGTVPLFRSKSLEQGAAVERAIVVIHGNRRDADHYFDALVKAVRIETDVSRRLETTLLLAPNFRTIQDKPSAREVYWSSHGWKIGDKSRDARRLSSFAVIDDLVSRLCAKDRAGFPKLAAVVIVGHSAGGQFVNRYAAGGAECTDPRIETRYVTINPSSYLYVDNRRKTNAAVGFAMPPPGCPKYDDYKYGLQDLNHYMARVGAARIRSQLFARKTHYVAGSEDTRTGGALDTRCQADLQGPNRATRHAIYREYVRTFDRWTGASFHSVPGIGHDGERMLQSQTVRDLMFR